MDANIKKEKNIDDLSSLIMSDNENQFPEVVKPELKPRVFALIDIPYYKTNQLKDTIELSNDQKNFMLHLEAVNINTPVTFFF